MYRFFSKVDQKKYHSYHNISTAVLFIYLYKNNIYTEPSLWDRSCVCCCVKKNRMQKMESYVLIAINLLDQKIYIIIFRNVCISPLKKNKQTCNHPHLHFFNAKRFKAKHTYSFQVKRFYALLFWSHNVSAIFFFLQP